MIDRTVLPSRPGAPSGQEPWLNLLTFYNKPDHATPLLNVHWHTVTLTREQVLEELIGQGEVFQYHSISWISFTATLQPHWSPCCCSTHTKHVSISGTSPSLSPPPGKLWESHDLPLLTGLQVSSKMYPCSQGLSPLLSPFPHPDLVFFRALSAIRCDTFYMYQFLCSLVPSLDSEASMRERLCPPFYFLYMSSIWNCGWHTVDTENQTFVTHSLVQCRGTGECAEELTQKAAPLKKVCLQVGPWLASGNLDFKRAPTIFRTDKSSSLHLSYLYNPCAFLGGVWILIHARWRVSTSPQ